MTTPTTDTRRREFTRPPNPEADSAAERYVARFVEAWAAEDNARLLELHAANFRLDSVLVQPLIHAAVGVQEQTESLARLLEMIPDLRATLVRWAVSGDTAFIEADMRGSFAGRPIAWRICDRFTLDGDDVLERESYFDSRAVGRQLARLRGLPRMRRAGMLPTLRPRGPEDPRLRWPARDELQPVADGVWRITGGFPRIMNIYLVRDGDGVMLFDAGVRRMREAVERAAARLGGITRVLLGHAHVDHRGVAPLLEVPVLCHPAEKPYAEGDAGRSYMPRELLNPARRMLMTALASTWDAGPVAVSDTVEEGDEVAGFRVVHLPGHAPGQIALWRADDGLALTTDCFFTVNLASGRPIPVDAPPPALSQDMDAARASMRKLAALEPRAAWPGHADPVLCNVRERLERAATR